MVLAQLSPHFVAVLGTGMETCSTLDASSGELVSALHSSRIGRMGHRVPLLMDSHVVGFSLLRSVEGIKFTSTRTSHKGLRFLHHLSIRTSKALHAGPSPVVGPAALPLMLLQTASVARVPRFGPELGRRGSLRKCHTRPLIQSFFNHRCLVQHAFRLWATLSPHATPIAVVWISPEEKAHGPE